ncbi:hypothetical protein ACJJTC_002334 [Scirpophaga incertulas]
MLTRSKLVRGDVLATSAADSGVPRADVLDRASGPVLAETLAAPNPVTVLSAQNLQNDVIQSTKSINSQRSSQSKSSATVRALRATAEAKLARQQLERQVQLENERRRIEELELAAELASIDAGHSSRILFQSTWKVGMGWDDELPLAIVRYWTSGKPNSLAGWQHVGSNIKNVRSDVV